MPKQKISTTLLDVFLTLARIAHSNDNFQCHTLTTRFAGLHRIGILRHLAFLKDDKGRGLGNGQRNTSNCLSRANSLLAIEGLLKSFPEFQVSFEICQTVSQLALILDGAEKEHKRFSGKRTKAFDKFDNPNEQQSRVVSRYVRLIRIVRREMRNLLLEDISIGFLPESNAYFGYDHLRFVNKARAFEIMASALIGFRREVHILVQALHTDSVKRSFNFLDDEKDSLALMFAEIPQTGTANVPQIVSHFETNYDEDQLLVNFLELLQRLARLCSQIETDLAKGNVSAKRKSDLTNVSTFILIILQRFAGLSCLREISWPSCQGNASGNSQPRGSSPRIVGTCQWNDILPGGPS